jgi:hypothetical protein
VPHVLGRLLLIATAGAVLACAPAQDGGADLLRGFFTDLQAHRFDAAADLVREADGAPLITSTRDRFVHGWRKAYEGYTIQFTSVVLHRIGDAPTEQTRHAGAVEGYVYDVRFEGTSNSPCVPVNSDVIPGTTQPIALKQANGTWFLLADAMVGFVDTCPGA